MLTVFFDWEGTVHHKYAPSGQTISKEFYFNLCQLKDVIQWKTATVMGNWWLAASSQQCTHSCVMSHAKFFGKTSNHPGDPAPCSPDLVPYDFLLFQKLKSPLKGKSFQTINEIQENMTEQLMMIRTTVWGSKVPTLKGTEVSLFYAQCFLYILQQMSLFFILHGWILSWQTSYISLGED